VINFLAILFKKIYDEANWFLKFEKTKKVCSNNLRCKLKKKIRNKYILTSDLFIFIYLLVLYGSFRIIDDGIYLWLKTEMVLSSNFHLKIN
jgi:hypothetical protein